jgi:DNA-directed RNA polymerase subunit RPC12/RpoP
MIGGSAQRSIGLTWGFASMPDRAKANSAFLRCQTRVVPPRTVNESLNGDAMRERPFLHLNLTSTYCSQLLSDSGLRLIVSLSESITEGSSQEVYGSMSKARHYMQAKRRRAAVRQGWRCYWCGKRISPQDVMLNYLRPTRADNYVAACRECSERILLCERVSL